MRPLERSLNNLLIIHAHEWVERVKLCRKLIGIMPVDFVRIKVAANIIESLFYAG